MSPRNDTASKSKDDRRRRQKTESARRCRERQQNEDKLIEDAVYANEKRIKKLEKQVDILSSELERGSHSK